MAKEKTWTIEPKEKTLIPKNERVNIELTNNSDVKLYVQLDKKWQ